jgi:hypothetical protein
MKVYGRISVSDILGNNLVYRDMQAIDERLPRFAELSARAGFSSAVIPRKTSVEYANIMVSLLGEAQRRRGLRVPNEKLVYVGDTRMNDGTAFTNIFNAGGWRGFAFIGSEDPQKVKVASEERPSAPIYYANRWADLDRFNAFLKARDLVVDETTVVLIDLDKTLLGARGRNDKVIDRARVVAAHHTVEVLLGDDFDPDSFKAAYDLFNQQEYHPFTTDNQDYLTYICLMVSAGLFERAELAEAVRAGTMASFPQFIGEVEGRLAALPKNLQPVHRGVYANVQKGDPTPFKDFRQNEFLVTTSWLGHLPDDTPVERLLQEEIVLTQEVRLAAEVWKKQGALLFSISDKPPEASVPNAKQRAAGYRAIHEIQTHAVGDG